MGRIGPVNQKIIVSLRVCSLVVGNRSTYDTSTLGFGTIQKKSILAYTLEPLPQILSATLLWNLFA
jgi:hypothetical protein